MRAATELRRHGRTAQLDTWKSWREKNKKKAAVSRKIWLDNYAKAGAACEQALKFAAGKEDKIPALLGIVICYTDTNRKKALEIGNQGYAYAQDNGDFIYYYMSLLAACGKNAKFLEIGEAFIRKHDKDTMAGNIFLQMAPKMIAAKQFEKARKFNEKLIKNYQNRPAMVKHLLKMAERIEDAGKSAK